MPNKISKAFKLAAFLCITALLLGACKTVSVSEKRLDPINVWQGQQSFIEKETAIVIEDNQTWNGLWRRIGKLAPRNLMTDREIAVAVFLGPRPTAGYRVEISHLEVGEDKATVEWRALTPAPDSMNAQVITSPWAVVIFEAVDVPVKLKKIR